MINFDKLRKEREGVDKVDVFANIKKYYPYIEITNEIRNIINDIVYDNKNIFIMGAGGVGKTEIIKLLNDSRINSKSVICTAPTGIASSYFKGGTTVHSLFKFGIDFLNINSIASKIEVMKNSDPNKYFKLRTLDILIIDEVSMINAKILDMVDLALQVVMDNFEPFGGKQIVLSGDIFQLEPVVRSGTAEEKLLKHVYGDKFFFMSESFKEYKWKYYELTKIFRQKDAEFLSNLIDLRQNEIGNYLDYFNKRVMEDSDFFAIDDFVYLCSTNDRAKVINHEQLYDIESLSSFFESIKEGDVDFRNTIMEETIELKVGCQVLICANDVNYGYYNGMLGVVNSLCEMDHEGETYIEVESGNNVYKIYRKTFEFYESSYDPSEKKIVKKMKGRITQFPIKLGYAITIHKSQGMSLNRAYIDLGRQAFASGQTYVALSRIRSIEGLALKRNIKEEDIIVDNSIKKFYNVLINEGIQHTQEINWKEITK